MFISGIVVRNESWGRGEVDLNNIADISHRRVNEAWTMTNVRTTCLLFNIATPYANFGFKL